MLTPKKSLSQTHNDSLSQCQCFVINLNQPFIGDNPLKYDSAKMTFFTPPYVLLLPPKKVLLYPKKVIVSKVSSLKSLFRHVKIYHNFVRCKKWVKTTVKQLAPDVLRAFNKMTTPTRMLPWPRIKRRPLRRPPISWRLFVGKPLWRLGSGDLHQVSMIYNIIHL